MNFFQAEIETKEDRGNEITDLYSREGVSGKELETGRRFVMLFGKYLSHTWIEWKDYPDEQILELFSVMSERAKVHDHIAIEDTWTGMQNGRSHK